MKQTVFLFFCFLLVAVSFFWYQSRTPCDRTFRYSIGDIDPRFEITEKEVIHIMETVESFWEDAVGINLFTYSPDSDFPVHFIYDNRQKRTQTAQILNKDMAELESSFEDFQSRHTTLQKEYEEIKTSFEQQVNLYNNRMQRFNTEVASWNKKGGAPDDIFQDFQSQKKTLQEERQNLDLLKQDIDQRLISLNSIAQKGNNFRENYNKTVQQHNELYGGEGEFSQGTWFPNHIEIYEFEDLSHLEFLLAHEFGHALGLDHVDDPQAIMYYLMEEQNLSNRSVTPSDITALETLCSLKVPLKNYEKR